jgi:hypothetical protein
MKRYAIQLVAKLVTTFTHLRHAQTVKRFRLNRNEDALPYLDMFQAAQDSRNTGWYLMPAWANLFHDDESGWPELKFCHVDGREYIYGSPNNPEPDYRCLLDDWRMGSFNYYPPIRDLRQTKPKRTLYYIRNVVLHLLFDLIPSYLPYIKDWPEGNHTQ